MDLLAHKGFTKYSYTKSGKDQQAATGSTWTVYAWIARDSLASQKAGSNQNYSHKPSDVPQPGEEHVKFGQSNNPSPPSMIKETNVRGIGMRLHGTDIVFIVSNF